MRYLIHSEVNILKKKDKYDDFEDKTNLNIKIADIYKIYSICNTIISENDTVDFANFYKRTYNYKHFAELVNNNFDCIVLSIDNIDKRIKVLDNITQFLKLVNIKVLIVGCNFMSESFLSSDIHKSIIIDFIKETLKHTNIIGVMENHSAKILNSMGFIEDKDYYICGHPSFFYRNKIMLKNKFPKLNRTTKICVNRNLGLVRKSNNYDNFFTNLYREYRNMYTLNTFLYEFNAVINSDNSFFKLEEVVNFNKLNNSKYRVYRNVEGYLEELSYYDFCIGERAEDCLMAISIGIPTILIVNNKKDKFIADYHKIPYIYRKNIKNDTTLNSIVNNVNYKLEDTIQNYNESLIKYLRFFEINGIVIDSYENDYTPFKKLLCENYKNNLPIDIDIPQEYFKDEFKSDHYVSSVRKQVFAVELDLLKKFQDICKKNNLRYFADAGTLLGAVRHKGFIPWDDDIDIIMPLEDYDKFVEIVKRDIPDLVQDVDECPLVWMTRLRNPNTTFISEIGFIDKYDFKQGLFIDIFPMYNVPEDDSEYRKYTRYLKCLKECSATNYKLYWLGGKTDEDLLKNALKLHKKFDEECIKYNNIETNVTAILTNSVANSFKGQEIRKWKEDFTDTISMDFEMLKIQAPIGYDNVLKKLYGDYMKIKKNGSLHGKMYMDPINSYEKYIKHE